MSTYGKGSITTERGKHRVRVPDGKGRRPTIGYYEDPEIAEQMRATALLERAVVGFGTTLRQYGEVWLSRIKHQKNIRSWSNTWRNTVLSAPFADYALTAIDDVEIDEWARSLLTRKKRRTKLLAGKRTSVELDEAISRQTAMHALGLLRRCLEMARKVDRIIDRNPAADIEIQKVERDDGAGEFLVAEPISYLPVDEIAQLLNFEQLPLEQKTVFTIGVCQAPREGELAGMDWERVDWAAHGWWIARSWKGTTKNRKSRWQQLLPMAEAALRAWWEHCGRPTTGIVFPSTHGQRVGPDGLRIKPKRPGPPRRYANGYDWGWADHPEKNVTRLGWWRRAGLRTRVRFHDFRDTCATHLLSGTWGKKWRIEAVSRHLGHSSVKVTEQRYAHLTRDSQREDTMGLNMEQTLAADGPHPLARRPRKGPESLASPAEVESATYGLGRRGSSGDSPGKTTFPDPLRPECGRLGLELLERVAGGPPHDVERLCGDLARAVLAASPLAALALGVLAGGPHALDQAIRLASEVLDWEVAADVAADAGGGS